MSEALTQDQLDARVSLLDEHLRAENWHDVNAVMETYGQNPLVIINGKTFGNFDSIRLFHERLGFGGRGGFSNLRVDERKRYISAEAIIIEQTLSGKHMDTWQGIEATGRAFEIPVCTIYRFDAEGKLAGENVYFDSALLLKQLGVLS